jgi:cytoskeletal protein CcmA (bactofilin family)
MQNKERAMFGKSKDDNDQLPSAVQQPQPAATKSAERVSANEISTISRGMTMVGKIVSEATVHVLGQVEGELRALTVLIDEGAKVEGDVVRGELTVGGTVKGTIHANRVKLNGTAVVRRYFSSIAIDRGKMRVLKDRQNVRIMLSMCPAPYCNARPPSATSRQRQPPARAIGNPMGCQAMMNLLTWEHRSLTRQRVSIPYQKCGRKLRTYGR